MKSIRAIYGYKRSGKDTLIKFINKELIDVSYKEMHGDTNLLMYPGIRYAFADSLKKHVSDILGVTIEYIDENKDVVIIDDILIRNHLVNHTYDKDWTQILLDQIKTDDHVIISDMRFMREYLVLKDYCKENNIEFKIIHIIKDGNIPHANEGELDVLEADLVLKW